METLGRNASLSFKGVNLVRTHAAGDDGTLLLRRALRIQRKGLCKSPTRTAVKAAGDASWI